MKKLNTSFWKLKKIDTASEKKITEKKDFWVLSGKLEKKIQLN